MQYNVLLSNLSPKYFREKYKHINMADLKTIVAQYQEVSKEWGKGKNRDNAKV